MPVALPSGRRPHRTGRGRLRHARPFRCPFHALLGFALAITLVFTGAGCSRTVGPAGPVYGSAASTGGPVYRFAVHPLYNPARLLLAYQPLIDYLDRELGTGRLVLEASRDYGTFEKKYRSRGPEFLLPNPWQTLDAEKVGYHVIAQAGDPADFKGIFVIRKDSGIRVPADLKGKAVSYPAETALAACIMPQMFLYDRGLDVVHAIRNRYVGSQESSIMNAYLGLTAAGATWPPPWRLFSREHPREAAELTVIWETPPLINNSVMVRDDVPTEVRDKVQALLTTLRAHPEGPGILARAETAQFRTADDGDYDVVQAYVARFEKSVRKVGSGG